MNHNYEHGTPKGGNGKIRRTIPRLGVVAAVAALAVNSFGSEDPKFGVNDLIHEVTIMHHARAQGIGEALRETDAVFSDQLTGKMHASSTIVGNARNDQTAMSIDMAISAGYLDALEGGWDTVRLEAYIDTTFDAEVSLRWIHDSAISKYERYFGAEQTQSYALSIMADAVLPGVVNRFDPGLSDGLRILMQSEVSYGAVDVLQYLDDLAYLPPSLEEGFSSRISCEMPIDVEDPFDSGPSCRMDP